MNKGAHRLCLTLLLVIGMTTLPTCGGKGNPAGPGPIPTPLPSPSPSQPPPPQLTPLRTSGVTFVDSTGRPVNLAGAIICCYDPYTIPHGWPYIDEAALDEIAEAGANYTHIRLGPFKREDDPLGGAYESDGTPTNQAYWSRIQDIINYALSRRIYVEVDVIDGWAIRHVLTAWPSWEGWCGVLQEAPQEIHRQWITKVAQELSAFPNVIFQVGNENGVCTPQPVSIEWESGVRQILLANMRNGRRLIGTNSQDPAIEAEMDYASYHGTNLPSVGGIPVQINEYRYLTPEAYRDTLNRASMLGVYFHLWRGTQKDEEWTKSLGYLKEWRASHP